MSPDRALHLVVRLFSPITFRVQLAQDAGRHLLKLPAHGACDLDTHERHRRALRKPIAKTPKSAFLNAAILGVQKLGKQ